MKIVQAKNEKSIYIKMLLEPVDTFKEVLNSISNRNMYILLFLASAADGIQQAAFKNMCDKNNLTFVLLTAIIGGAIFGIVTYYIFGALLSWTGKWLSGNADTSKMITVLAWASIPTVISIATIFIEILFTGDRIFKSYPNISNS